VRQNDFNTALHGDTVRVKVLKENLNSGRKEGKITEVISRKQTEFIGHLQVSANFAFLFQILINQCQICLFHWIKLTEQNIKKK
jgi:exoribonuclease R